MADYRAAIIGCGRREQGSGGALGIAESHARTYERHPHVKLVAAADISAENLNAFCVDHATTGYQDYRELLAQERPDIVSICTWPPLHAEMAIMAAQAGVRAIWCEKPMALSLDDLDRMLVACDQSGTYLQVNHQRRFGEPFQRGREFIRQGRLGKLERIEGYVPGSDLLTWGTHWIDLMRFLVDDQPALWVAGQIDCQSAKRLQGHYVEDHAIVTIAFQDGIRGYLELGEGGTPSFGLRAYGSKGFILLDEDPGARALIQGESDWLTVSGPSDWYENLFRALEDLIATLEQPGHQSLLNGRNAHATTEIILAAYESAYRSGRVKLPLDVLDFPLARLVAKQTERGE